LFLRIGLPFFDFHIVWEYNGSSPRLGKSVPTSPLVLKSPATQKASFRHKDAFGTTDESDLSADEGDMPLQPLSSNVDGKAEAPSLAGSDDEAGTTTRSRTRAIRKNIVLSEDELENTNRFLIETSKPSKVVPRQRREDTTTIEKSLMGAEIPDSQISGVVASNGLASTSCSNIKEFICEKTDAVCHNDVRAESQIAVGLIPLTEVAAKSHLMTKTSTILPHSPMLFLTNKRLYSVK
jgi:hypothetical protein